jgi:mannose-6-phosphate isomerase
MKTPFLKFNPYNFVPLNRTPWAGQLIGATKIKSLDEPSGGWPERIGESWEISTDPEFPSMLNNVGQKKDEPILFTDVLNEHPEYYLGRNIANEFSSHCPLLLKWLNAQEPLSVQVHPKHSHPALKANQCGKPESWFVMSNAFGQGYIFLGFKDGLSKDDIMTALREDRPRDVMNVIYPKAGSYISIPTGCVHAVGPGLLITEPQYVLPKKSGTTWRLSDWGRRYNSRGEQDPQGQPRELHINDGLTAIDWDLPRGQALEKELVHQLEHGHTFAGDKHNPFPVRYFSKAGIYQFKPLIEDQFTLVTCWEGMLQLITKNDEAIVLRAGESGLIAAAAGEIKIALAEPRPLVRPECAFFTFSANLN